MISWSGTDLTPGSGLASYDIYYKDGQAGSWTRWLSATTQTYAFFSGGIKGHTYYFVSAGRDNAGNVEVFSSTGDGDTATTVTGPLVTSPQATSITATSAQIQWTTNVFTTSIVKYGVSSVTENTLANVTSLASDHSVSLSGLQYGTTYKFMVDGVDIRNNDVPGTVMTFRTSDLVNSVNTIISSQGIATVEYTTTVAQMGQLAYANPGQGYTYLTDPTVSQYHRFMFVISANATIPVSISDAYGAVVNSFSFNTPASISSNINWNGTPQEYVMVNGQKVSNWCWAANTQGALRFNGVEVKQADVVCNGKGIPCSPAPTPDQSDTGGWPWDSTKAIQALGQGLTGQWTISAFPWSSVKSELLTPNPILAFVKWDNSLAGHVLAIWGYAETATASSVNWWDPWDGMTHTTDWSTFQDSNYGFAKYKDGTDMSGWFLTGITYGFKR
jgi:hypothetical protein